EEDSDEVIDGLWCGGMCGCQVLLPVDPTSHIVTVIKVLNKYYARHCEQYSRLRTRPGREPVISHASSIREARVHHCQFGPFHLTLDNALCLWIEIVTRLQV